MAENLTAAELSSLRDAEAALRLINATLEVRGQGELELTSLEFARARTIQALDSLLRRDALWNRLGQQPIVPVDRVAAKNAVASELADVLIRVGHVRPPPPAEIIDMACRTLDDLSPDTGITATDVVSATKFALHQLRARLHRLARLEDEEPAEKPTSVEDQRSGMRVARSALLHLVTAGGLAIKNAPAAVLAITQIATTVGWGGLTNVGTDIVMDEVNRPAAVVQPAQPQPAQPRSSATGNPLAELRNLHRQRPQLDPIVAKDLRQDLLDDLAGSEKWSAAFRLARLDQLIMEGAVPAAEATLARKELEYRKAREEDG